MSKPDELETVIEELERSESDRPSVEIILKESKNSVIPKIPNTRLAQVVAGLVAVAAIVKLVWEIIKL